MIHYNLNVCKPPQPPAYIEGARVLAWTFQSEKPIFVYTSPQDMAIAVFGIAICQLPNTTEYIVYACRFYWDVIYKETFTSMEEAKQTFNNKHLTQELIWHTN